MRVLVVADVVGGVRTFVADLARGLAARGVELHLALLGEPADAQPLASLPVASCEVRNLRLEWMPGGLEDVPAVSDWIEALCAEHRPDVIHLNTFAALERPESPILLTVHSCVLSWWLAVHGVAAPAQWQAYRRLASDALARAGAVATPTRALLRALEGIYGPLPHARVIANGSAVPAAVVGERERLVVSAGRLWDEAKNVALLVEAASLIDGEVVVIGSGQNDVRAGRNLRSLGPLPHAAVLEWFRRAAVFAEPARYEPFGLAALEAARCGCALVLGNIPSLREVWGEAAAYVDPGDPDALAAAVGRLLRDPARRRGAAVAAQRAAERYRPEAMAEAYARELRALAPVRA